MAETEGVGPRIRAHCCQLPDIIFIFRRRIWDSTATRKVDVTDQKKSGHPRFSRPTFRVVCCSKHLLAAPLIVRNIGAWKSNRVRIHSNLVETPMIRTILGRHTMLTTAVTVVRWREVFRGRIEPGERKESLDFRIGGFFSGRFQHQITGTTLSMRELESWRTHEGRAGSRCEDTDEKTEGREGRDGEGRRRGCFFGTSRPEKLLRER